MGKNASKASAKRLAEKNRAAFLEGLLGAPVVVVGARLAEDAEDRWSIADTKGGWAAVVKDSAIKASKNGRPGAILGTLDERWTEAAQFVSLLSEAKWLGQSQEALLARWIEADVVDSRAQMLCEHLIERWGITDEKTIWGRDPEPAAVAKWQASSPEAAAWGCFLEEQGVGLRTAAECRALIKALTPLLASQYPADAAKLGKEAIEWAIGPAPAHLPKASLRGALTREEKELERVARRCKQFARNLGSALDRAGRPTGEMAIPKVLAETLAAFDAKARADAEAAALAASNRMPNPASKSASKPNAGAEGQKAAGGIAGAAVEDEETAAPPPPLPHAPRGVSDNQLDQISAARRKMTLAAAESGDWETFKWLVSEGGCPGSSWSVSLLRRDEDTILRRMAHGVSNEAAFHDRGRKGIAAATVAAQMMGLLVETGLDLVAESRQGPAKESNPFWRARKALAGDASGILGQAWVEALCAQMRKNGVSKEDALKMLNSALDQDGERFDLHPFAETFPAIALARMESWSLQDEMDLATSATSAPSVESGGIGAAVEMRAETKSEPEPETPLSATRKKRAPGRL